MKKMLATLAVAAVALGLGIACEPNPPDEGDFNVQWGADTSTVKTVAAGELAGFKYLIKNNSDKEMTLKIDAPGSATELPENWNFQICVDISCMAPGTPAYAHVAAGALSDTVTFDIMTVTGTAATEGSVSMLISDSSGANAEVDTVVLTAKIQQ